MYASDGDTGSLTYTTNDVFEFSGGYVQIDESATVSGSLTVNGDSFFNGAITATPSDTNDITFTLDGDSDLILSGITADTDDTVLILNSANEVQTREIDPDVWTPGTLIDGSGNTGQVTFWSDTDSVSGNNDFFWDDTNELLGIGTNGSPVSKLDINGSVIGKALVSLN